jgi:hypothetical protein
MTTLHVRWIGDDALVPRAELERLLELARRSEQVQVEPQSDDVPNAGILWLAQQGGAFDWLADEPDLYTVDDLKVRYR